MIDRQLSELSSQNTQILQKLPEKCQIFTVLRIRPQGQRPNSKHCKWHLIGCFLRNFSLYGDIRYILLTSDTTAQLSTVSRVGNRNERTHFRHHIFWCIHCPGGLAATGQAKTLKNIFEALTGLNGLIMGLKFRTISPLQLLYIEGFQKIEYLMRYHPWL